MLKKHGILLNKIKKVVSICQIYGTYVGRNLSNDQSKLGFDRYINTMWDHYYIFFLFLLTCKLYSDHPELTMYVLYRLSIFRIVFIISWFKLNTKRLYNNILSLALSENQLKIPPPPSDPYTWIRLTNWNAISLPHLAHIPNANGNHS